MTTATAVCRQRGGEGASKMKWFAAALALCVLVPRAHCATPGVAWCYHDPTCNEATWATIAPQFCNGSRQSPVNLDPASAQADSSLVPFTFHNFSSTTTFRAIVNTGKTVRVDLNNDMTISRGALPDTFYDSLQFHLHWGNGSSIPGSEHTVNGKRYAMELHIVNSKGSLMRNITQALADSTGFAALGFFIEVMPGNATGQPASWNTLSSYLNNIPNSGDTFNVPNGISMQDLLVGVDNSRYYRYLGSLTTPTCNEAVLWTVFKDTIKVSADVINRFSTRLRVGNSSSPYAIDTFRSIQPQLPVSTQAATSGSGTGTCYSLGLMALSLVLGAR